eukprot:scaffold25398_cov63-Phaeocystis_antarctica.AAC.5
MALLGYGKLRTRLPVSCTCPLAALSLPCRQTSTRRRRPAREGRLRARMARAASCHLARGPTHRLRNRPPAWRQPFHQG